MVNWAEGYEVGDKHCGLSKVFSESVHLRANLLLLCPTSFPCCIHFRFLFHCYTLAQSRKMSNSFAYFFRAPEMSAGVRFYTGQ